MQTTPEKQHRWLQQLVGEWTIESKFRMGPDEPEGQSTGTEHVRRLGDLWVVCDGTACMSDGSHMGTMMMTLGYDPGKKQFVGAWVGSMMANLWTYTGELDASEKVLPLEAEGPSFNDPTKTGKYRDTIEILDSDHRTLTSSMLGDDGKWVTFMTAHYRRVK